jgi:hypothetical protein
VTNIHAKHNWAYAVEPDSTPLAVFELETMIEVGPFQSLLARVQ